MCENFRSIIFEDRIKNYLIFFSFYVAAACCNVLNFISCFFLWVQYIILYKSVLKIVGTPSAATFSRFMTFRDAHNVWRIGGYQKWLKMCSVFMRVLCCRMHCISGLLLYTYTTFFCSVYVCVCRMRFNYYYQDIGDFIKFEL